MKLATYLETNRIKRTDFADAIGVSPAYVTALCAGTYWPSRPVIMRIREATGGTVTADDFLPSSEGAAA